MGLTLDEISQHALANKGTTFATYDIALSVLGNGIEGCFVECGVFKGAQVAAMAKACLQTRPLERCPKIHLFDSFQGIPKAGPQDGVEGPQIEGKSVCSLETVKHFLFRECELPQSLFVFHPGWFNETVPGALAGEDIALLRLDADLYASTKICMEEFFPKLSKGGWLIVDDYVLPGCRKAVEETLPGGLGPAYHKQVR